MFTKNIIFKEKKYWNYQILFYTFRVTHYYVLKNYMYFKNNKHYFFLFLRNSRKKLYISEFVNNMLNILDYQFFLTYI